MNITLIALLLAARAAAQSPAPLPAVHMENCRQTIAYYICGIWIEGGLYPQPSDHVSVTSNAPLVDCTNCALPPMLTIDPKSGIIMKPNPTQPPTSLAVVVQ